MIYKIILVYSTTAHINLHYKSEWHHGSNFRVLPQSYHLQGRQRSAWIAKDMGAMRWFKGILGIFIVTPLWKNLLRLPMLAQHQFVTHPCIRSHPHAHLMGWQPWKAPAACWPCLRFPAKGPHLKFPARRRLETKEIALGSHCSYCYSHSFCSAAVIVVNILVCATAAELSLFLLLLVLFLSYSVSVSLLLLFSPQSPHLDSIGLGEGSFPGIVAVSCLASRKTLVASSPPPHGQTSRASWKLQVLWHRWHMISGIN